MFSNPSTEILYRGPWGAFHRAAFGASVRLSRGRAEGASLPSTRFVDLMKMTSTKFTLKKLVKEKRKEKKVQRLSKFTILCRSTFIVILGYRWPLGCRSDVTYLKKKKPLSGDASRGRRSQKFSGVLTDLYRYIPSPLICYGCNDVPLSVCFPVCFLFLISEQMLMPWEQHAGRVSSTVLAHNRCLINICSIKYINRI